MRGTIQLVNSFDVTFVNPLPFFYRTILLDTYYAEYDSSIYPILLFYALLFIHVQFICDAHNEFCFEFIGTHYI